MTHSSVSTGPHTVDQTTSCGISINIEHEQRWQGKRDAHRIAIRELYGNLRLEIHLGSSGVLDEMISKNVLPEDDGEIIRSLDVRTHQNEAFLSYVMTNVDIDSFLIYCIPCLKTSHPALIEKLLSAMKRFSIIGGESICPACSFKELVDQYMFQRLALKLFSKGTIPAWLREDLSNFHLSNEDKWKKLVAHVPQTKLLNSIGNTFPVLNKELNMAKLDSWECKCKTVYNENLLRPCVEDMEVDIPYECSRKMSTSSSGLSDEDCPQIRRGRRQSM